jgi:3-hydroxybutyryl-CoA dehydrogenase
MMWPAHLSSDGVAPRQAGGARRRKAVEIRKVGVVGCGLMGAGIAEVCVRAGFDTVVREVSDDLLARGIERIERSLGAATERGKLTPEARDEARRRLRGVTALEGLGDRDLVVEAVTESLDAKRAVFAALDRACEPHAILASNTSSIPIIDLASATSRPERVVGLHFMNPVPVMRLVELVRAITTSDATRDAARAFGVALGKRVIVAKDRAGFIVNMLLVPYLLEAIRMAEAGVATREDIDLGMVLGTNHPMGPLTLADYIGLDTVSAIAQILYEEHHSPHYAPPPLLRRMVAAGFLGRKSGRGFYDYAAGEAAPRP